MRRFEIWIHPEDSDNGELLILQDQKLVPLDKVAKKVLQNTSSTKALKSWKKKLQSLTQEIQDRIEALAEETKEEKEFERGFVEDMQDDSWETEYDPRE